MPIFVDHAGMNTLINQELDLSTNTLNTGSNRIGTGEVIDRAIGGVATSTVGFAGLDSSETSASYSGQITFTNGMAISTWINLNGTNNGLHRTIFLAYESFGGGMTTTSMQVWFNSGSALHFSIRDSDGGGNTWRFGVTESDFVDTWKHIYLNYNGNTSTGSVVAGDVRLWVNNSEVTGQTMIDGAGGAGSGLGSAGGSGLDLDYITLFDAPGNNTFYELDGKLQNFTLYNSESTSRVTALYNSNTASIDLSAIPNQSDVVAHFYLGNEQRFSLADVGDGVGSLEIEPVIGTVTGSTNRGKLKQSTSFLRLVDGQRGTYITSSGELLSGHVGRVAEVNTLSALNTQRNGPYGYSSWQQLRVSNNPLSRHQRSSNTMTFVTSPGPVKNVLATGDLRVRDRYSTLYNFKEPAVTQKSYPLVWNVGRHFKDEDGNVDMENPQRFSIISSYGNQQIAFSNEKVNKLHKFDPDEEQTEYAAIKDMYLENGLNKQDSPLTHWEFLQYRETIFPKATQQYVSQSRTRPNFKSFYRHERSLRNFNLPTGGAGPFGFPSSLATGHQLSTWPLDVEIDFLTRTYGSDILSMTAFGNFRGVLTNIASTYSPFMISLAPSFNATSSESIELAAGVVDAILAPFPIYSRRVSLSSSNAVSNPSGMLIDTTGTADTIIEFRGNALWEAGAKRQVRNSDGTYTSSPKLPFYDTYENYVEDVRKYGKNYSIIPEFRMSSQVEDYRRTDGEIELDMFEVTGGDSNNNNSSHSKFYEVYSNTDFLRNFEIIADDHDDFTNGKVLSLRCKAIKKFLPYEGFYPCQRTVDLAKRFYDSFSNNIKMYNSQGIQIDNFNYGRQMVMAPLFSPGVLFNTIKSGVAVDYPVITSSLEQTSSGGLRVLGNLTFDKRIPFEALITPEKHLVGYRLTNNEPHMSGNISSSALWDGQGDQFYSMMANNFFAESINFFFQMVSYLLWFQKNKKIFN